MTAVASLLNESAGDAQQAWEECKQILKGRVSTVEFSTWVEPVAAESFDGERFKLVVPNRFHKDYLTRIVDLSGAFEQVLGRPVRVSFREEARKEENGVEVPAGLGRPPRQVEMRRVGVSAGPLRQSRPPSSGLQRLAGPAAVPLLDDSGLQSSYSFDRFVEGACNKLARGLGMMVSESGTAHSFNPLVVCGQAGVGKTHLLQAIGNRAVLQGLRVRYLTSERFVSSFVRSLKGNSAWSFTRSFSDIDLLLVDDVQFLGKTEKIQEQFATVFNGLIEENHQVILSFDRIPSRIPGLHSALVSRLQGGVMAELTPPGFETRRQIVQQRAVELGLDITEDTLDVIARTRGSVRQLEGILNRLFAEQTFGMPSHSIGSVIAEVTGEEVGALNIREIARIVSEKTGVSLDLMRGRSRRRPHVQARHLAMFLCRVVTHDTYTSIAEFFDGRDHSSVMHGVQSIEDLRDVDADLNRLVEDLLRSLGAGG